MVKTNNAVAWHKVTPDNPVPTEWPDDVELWVRGESVSVVVEKYHPPGVWGEWGCWRCSHVKSLFLSNMLTHYMLVPKPDSTE